MQSSFSLFFGALLVCAIALRTAPDVSAEVARETQENIQIHDGFQSQEQKDIKAEQAVKANKDLFALQLSEQTRVKKSSDIVDPCANIKCAAPLNCPGGFTATTVEGHCCPYCVNPDIKLEAEVKGATGSSGGAASTFCKDVWCFPTMCTGTLEQPTTTNGKCCPTCPA
mmetsp:Transcript_51407/g.111521  ORF Transcript_51407/g.111521 Transcript_51407/m.111521 type:complete len:169 (-) Transcript_51407:95-601(-)